MLHLKNLDILIKHLLICLIDLKCIIMVLTADVDILFKKFANKNESKYNLLLKVLETPKDKSTLYDVYNALTNYSSHNQRAVKYASKIKLTGGHEDYKLDNCKKKLAEDRDFEVRNFINSNTFVYYYHKGLSNYSKQISQ